LSHSASGTGLPKAADSMVMPGRQERVAGELEMLRWGQAGLMQSL
jgi:hypothetical protein